jgi:hypothetical protein
MFELVRHIQELAIPATLGAACIRGSVSTAEEEASAIVSGFAGANFEANNDNTYLSNSLESRSGYHDHSTIAKAIIDNSLISNQDVTGNVSKTAGTCPS